MELFTAIQLGLYSFLFMANFYYLYSFHKLENKKFHLMMFGLLQVCFAMAIAGYLFYVEYLKEQSKIVLYFTALGLV
jgi:hypothetical protein